MKPPYGSEAVGAVTMALARISVAKTLLAKDRDQEALALLRETRGTLLTALGPLSFQVGLIDYEMANIVRQDDNGETTRLLREAHAAFAASLGTEHGYTRTIGLNLAIGEISNGDVAAGLKALESLLPWYKERAGSTDAVDLTRAEALNKLGRYAEALKVLDGLDVEKAVWGLRDVKGQKWSVQGERGLALIGLGQIRQGRQLLQEAVSNMQDEGTPSSFVERYGMALRKR